MAAAHAAGSGSEFTWGQTYVGPTMRGLARGTAWVLLPAFALAMGAVAVVMAYVNVRYMATYVPATYGLSWATAFGQEVFILAGEATLMINAVAMRSRWFVTLGAAVTVAGNATSLAWHIQCAPAEARIGLVQLVVFGALAMLTFVATAHRCITLTAAFSAPDRPGGGLPVTGDAEPQPEPVPVPAPRAADHDSEPAAEPVPNGDGLARVIRMSAGEQHPQLWERVCKLLASGEPYTVRALARDHRVHHSTVTKVIGRAGEALAA